MNFDLKKLEDKIYNIIVDTLSSEEKELRNIKGHDDDNYIGVLSAPELYLAFLIGKNITSKLSLALNEEIVWNREVNKSYGFTDFEFTIGEQIFAFELKIKQTWDSYINDIDKLNKNYEDNINKYFIYEEDYCFFYFFVF